VAVWAIGDVQGCHRELRELLRAIAFDRRRDMLWFVGDLVNRGPDSLGVLRFVRGLGRRAVVVLGNHDFHLLALAHGAARPREDDTLDAVLAAPDRDALLTWLRQRPLLHWDDGLGIGMVHAGLAPQWDFAQARALAGEVEAVLRGPEHAALYPALYGDEPPAWRDNLAGPARLRVIVNFMARVRFVDAAGAYLPDPKGAPEEASPGVIPWYAAPGRRSAGTRLVFGHWSALGYRELGDVTALDSGCVWGGKLTAVRLDGHQELAQVPCPGVAGAAILGPSRAEERS
jgi:bis(5'-nucleosyl)-tetraphosphatase (symmetrical)